MMAATGRRRTATSMMIAVLVVGVVMVMRMVGAAVIGVDLGSEYMKVGEGGHHSLSS